MNREDEIMFEYERKKLDKELNGDFIFGLVMSSTIACVIILLIFLIVT